MKISNDKRPDPDALLDSIAAEDKRSDRGKLKIYLGMAAGVGKTYAMLSDALEDKQRGRDVVAGYIEPHGRKETEALVEPFEQLPTQESTYRGVNVHEFDLDAAIARHPEILLVDELAHTNSPGSRHPKRYQDVRELLALGIEVRTTVNIQHIESLNDVVARMTGVAVQETVPDSVFLDADEVEVIDLPPAELIQRIREGKIYRPDKIQDAIENFFTTGNLTILRELVLRHAADRVSAQVWRYRSQQSIGEIWPTKERVLVCVAPDAFSSFVVREARRLATTLNGELLALSVETPRYAQLSLEARSRAAQTLRLAEELGAECILRTASDIVPEIVDVARARNVTQIVVGKPPSRVLADRLRRSTLDQLIDKSGEISIHLVSTGAPKVDTRDSLRRGAHDLRQNKNRALIDSLLITAAVTAIAWPIASFIAPTNIVMLYLLGVTWSAVGFGRLQSVLTAIFGVVAFDFFFVPPFFTFRVSDIEYLFTFSAMLVVGLTIATLTSRIRAHAQIVSDREQRTAALYDLTKKLSDAQSVNDIAAVLVERVHATFGMDSLVIVPFDGSKPLAGFGHAQTLNSKELTVAHWVFEHGEQAGKHTDTLPSAEGFHLPLKTGRGNFAVLTLFPEAEPLDSAKRALLDAFCTHAALALERVRSDEQSQRTTLLIEEERLRSSFLSAISHDLRTPLASIEGAATTLRDSETVAPQTSRELAATIADEAQRLGRMIRNILDITRLAGAPVVLKREWHSIEEILGSAIRRTERLLGDRKLEIALSPELPLLLVDGLLIEQLFVNLLENIARHTAPGTAAVIRAGVSANNEVVIEVSDYGAGIPAGMEQSIFTRHAHAAEGAAKSGSPQSSGLGLSICRAIMLAHKGSIQALNRPGVGATFIMRFPITETPPGVEHE